MKHHTYYLGLAAVLVASCSTREMNLQTPIQSDVVFRASFEQPVEAGTRVYAGEDLFLRWNAEDRISIFNKNTANLEYIFTGETDDNAGGFRKVDTGVSVDGKRISHVVSVYPYQEATEISNSEAITVTLPAEQDYNENSFGVGANTMVSVSSGNVLQYKNVGGYLVLKLYGEGVTVSSITLKGNNDETIAGTATVTMPLDGVPTMVLGSGSTKEITLICDTPVELGATEEESQLFWFVVPPVTFSKGFTITVYDPNGGPFTKSTSSSVSIERNIVSKIPSLEAGKNYNNIFISFEDKEFQDYCVWKFDSNNDKKISIEEAKKATKISVSSHKWSITSLSGIEYFVNLTELECTDNQLTRLDVSKNTALKRLICDNNQITSLDLSNNMELEYLACYCNQLTSLDVSNHALLQELYGSYNQLTSLNVSGCTSLTLLGGNENQLTSLDVSECTSLKYLDCFVNQLTSLDVSKNTALLYISCSENQLTDLDVSKNTALEILECDKNLFTSLDVSNNLALKYLYCCDNPYLTEIWLKSGQTIEDMQYDKNVATIKYK